MDPRRQLHRARGRSCCRLGEELIDPYLPIRTRSDRRVDAIS